MNLRRNLQIFIAGLILDADDLIGSSSASLFEALIYSSADALAEISSAASSGTSCAEQNRRWQEKRASRNRPNSSGGEAAPADVPEVYRQIPPRPNNTNSPSSGKEYGYAPGENPTESEAQSGSSSWPEPPKNDSSEWPETPDGGQEPKNKHF